MTRGCLKVFAVAVVGLAAVVSNSNAQENSAAGQVKVKVGAQAPMLQGEIVRVVGNDQVIVRTPEGKEMTVFVGADTKYKLTAQGGQLTDLKPGSTIGVQYIMRDDRPMANEVIGLTRVEGQIVRVVGKDQVIVRTSDGKEVVVYVSPQTIYQLTAQGGQFTDLRAGTDVHVYYDINAQRNIARGFFRRGR